MTVMSYLAALKQPISTVFEVNTDDNKLTHFIRASGCDFRGQVHEVKMEIRTKDGAARIKRL